MKIKWKIKFIIWLLEKIFNIKIDTRDARDVKDIVKALMKPLMKKKQIRNIILYIILGELAFGCLCVFIVHIIKIILHKLRIKKA